MANGLIPAPTRPAPMRIDSDPVTCTQPAQSNNPKTQDRDTITCCCTPCFQGIWRSIRNLFVAIWTFICCKCKTEHPSHVEDRSRSWGDRMLKSLYETTEEPNYEGLDQHSLLIGSRRYLYTELLFELTDVEYEPKRRAVPIDTIKAIIRKIDLPDNLLIRECLDLCDTQACTRDKNYSALREKLQKLDKALRPSKRINLEDEKR